jgi:hypothetical protein
VPDDLRQEVGGAFGLRRRPAARLRRMRSDISTVADGLSELTRAASGG